MTGETDLDPAVAAEIAAIAADERSAAELIGALGDDALAELAEAIGEKELGVAWRSWGMWSRAAQREPEGIWRVWLIMAGRGFGKTRSGAEWVRMIARRRGGQRIALVGATLHEARSVMIEGEAGLLSVCGDDERPAWEPSLGRLRWANGTIATLFSAAEPDSLRGPSHDAAWADEIAKWDEGVAAWDNLMLTLRRGDFPRVVATTTPKPVALVRRLVDDPKVARSRGRSRDNRLHVPEAWLAGMRESYAGTRLGRQELDGELIEDVAGSLWPRELIEGCRVSMDEERVLAAASQARGCAASPPPPFASANGPPPRASSGRISFARIVVAVDPPAGTDGDACGIVVAGLGEDGRGYVLEDASVSGARPGGWARAVAGAAARWNADRVIAEANQGGAMIEDVLRAVERDLPLRLVHATKGKGKRAEPVAALYEQGRVSHAGSFAALEDEMAGMTIAGGYEGPGRSPDRADALVWALTELMLKKAARPAVRGLW